MADPQDMQPVSVALTLHARMLDDARTLMAAAGPTAAPADPAQSPPPAAAADVILDLSAAARQLLQA